MKKIMHLILITTLVFSIFTGVSFASSRIKVVINGQELITNTPAQIVDGRTVVPLRAIFESLGATVKWEGSTQTITGIKEEIEVVLRIGDKNATVNGSLTTLDVPALIIDGRTMVPARFVAESLGAGVKWDANTSTIKVSEKEGGKAIEQEVISTKKEVLLPRYNSKWLKSGRAPYNESNGFFYVSSFPGFDLVSAESGETVLNIGNQTRLNSYRSIIHGNVLYGITGSEISPGSFYKVDLGKTPQDINESDLVLLYKNYSGYYAGVSFLSVIDSWLYFTSKDAIKKLHIETGEMLTLQNSKAISVFISDEGFIYIDGSSGQYNLIKADLNLKNKTILIHDIHRDEEVWRWYHNEYCQIFVNDNWIYVSDLTGAFRVDHNGKNKERVLNFNERLTYEHSQFSLESSDILTWQPLIYGLVEVKDSLFYPYHHVKFLDMGTYKGPLYTKDEYDINLINDLQSGSIEREPYMNHFREENLELIKNTNGVKDSLYSTKSHAYATGDTPRVDYMMDIGDWVYFRVYETYPDYEWYIIRANVITGEIERTIIK